MSDYCVVVAGGAEARFFTLEPADTPEIQSGPNLVEHEVLVNPEKHASGGEIFSDAKSGRNRGAAGTHGYDDHRDRHLEESGRRFAKSIAQSAAQLVKSSAANRLVLVAEKQLLGQLRGEVEALGKNGLTIRDCAKELSKLPPIELHAHLAKEQLLPARKGPEHP